MDPIGGLEQDTTDDQAEIRDQSQVGPQEPRQASELLTPKQLLPVDEEESNGAAVYLPQGFNTQNLKNKYD
jgi:hypothetical protein